MNTKIKAFYYKSAYNFDKDNITSREFHTILYFLLKSYNLLYGEPKVWWR